MPGLYTKTVVYYMRKVAALLQYVVPPTAAKKNRTGLLNGFSAIFIFIILILAQHNSSLGNARAVRYYHFILYAQSSSAATVHYPSYGGEKLTYWNIGCL
jgi:hypothetical protein